MATQTTLPLLTVGDVGKLLRVSRATVHRLVERGRLEPVQFAPGGHLRFRREDVDELVEQSRRGDR
jgi:excisionase family DNA binding protein